MSLALRWDFFFSRCWQRLKKSLAPDIVDEDEDGVAQKIVARKRNGWFLRQITCHFGLARRNGPKDNL